MATFPISGGNLLLETLSPDTLRQLATTDEDHLIRDVLVRPDETPSYVFFPHFGAVVSIVRSTESGAMIETGVVGHAGMFSVHTVLTTPAPIVTFVTSGTAGSPISVAELAPVKTAQETVLADSGAETDSGVP